MAQKKKKKPRKHTSLKQVLANQANAQKSTGPTSAPGKAKSSQNAVDHGGYSNRRMLLDNEDSETFQTYYDALMSDIHPQDMLARQLADDYIWDCWKLKRFRAWEARRLSDLNKNKDSAWQMYELDKISRIQRRYELSRDRSFKRLQEYQKTEHVEKTGIKITRQWINSLKQQLPHGNPKLDQLIQNALEAVPVEAQAEEILAGLEVAQMGSFHATDEIVAEEGLPSAHRA